MLEHLRDLLAHGEWADAVFFRSWAGSDREDREMRERASHWAGTQELFLKVLSGEDDIPWEAIRRGEARPPWEGPLRGFDALRDYARANHGRLRELAGRLDEGALERDVHIPWIGEPPCVIKVKEALVQAVMHTQHHRGQNMTRLRLLGGQVRNVDYILWVWKGRPAARWDS